MISDPWSGSQSFRYDGEGNLAEADLANGAVTTNSYDADGNLAQTKAQLGLSVLQSFDYSYNLADQLTSQTDRLGAQTTYDYDALGRLTQFNPPGQPATSYGYDAAGNRTSVGNTTYAYNALNQLVHGSDGTDYSYDGSGRLTQVTQGSQTTTYGWNILDQMTSASPPSGAVNYTYDGLGRPSSRIAAGTTTISHYGDLTDAPVFDTDASGGITASYVLGPATGTSVDGLGQTPSPSSQSPELPDVNGLGIPPAGELLEQRSGTSTTYPLADVHGNVTSLLDGSGAVISRQSYDPWGTQLSGPTQQLGYLGAFERPTDPSTGLVRMGIRQYDPVTGRFLSEDPVLARIGLGQSSNGYGYALGDPLNLYDLSGRTTGPSMPPQAAQGGPYQNGFSDVGNALGKLAGLLPDPPPPGELACDLTVPEPASYLCNSSNRERTFGYAKAAWNVLKDWGPACGSGVLAAQEYAPYADTNPYTGAANIFGGCALGVILKAGFGAAVFPPGPGAPPAPRPPRKP